MDPPAGAAGLLRQALELLKVAKTIGNRPAQVLAEEGAIDSRHVRLDHRVGSCFVLAGHNASLPNIPDRAHTSSPTERIKASALLFCTTPGRIR